MCLRRVNNTPYYQKPYFLTNEEGCLHYRGSEDDDAINPWKHKQRTPVSRPNTILLILQELSRGIRRLCRHALYFHSSNQMRTNTRRTDPSPDLHALAEQRRFRRRRGLFIFGVIIFGTFGLFLLNQEEFATKGILPASFNIDDLDTISPYAKKKVTV